MKGVSNKIIKDFEDISTLVEFLLVDETDRRILKRVNKIKEICKKYMEVS